MSMMMIIIVNIVLLVGVFFNVANGTAVHIPFGAEHSHRPQSHPRFAALQPRGGGAAAVADHVSKIRRFTDASSDRMPCLFSQEEEIYDRYAACLAATEGLRRIRDRDITEQQESILAAATSAGRSDNSNKASGGGGLVPDSIRLQAVAEAKHRITTKYVQQSIKVLRALGMTVSQFNGLGRDIAKDDKLKEKVMEQAYLYRMAATVNMDRSHFIEDPNNTFSSATASSSPSSSSSSTTLPPREGGFQRDKVALFAKSMSEIEKLRAGQLERLKQYLHVEEFPEHVNISDPSLLPFLSPKVRAVVEAFPLQAEAIVKRQGLNSDEFNQMLQATKSNPIFRWKIQKVLRDSAKTSNKQRTPSGPSPVLKSGNPTTIPAAAL